jgi:hypothetical protein
MAGIFKLPGLKSINGVKMTLDTLNKKCDSCGLFLKRIDFYKNKSKTDGLHNRCKDCMMDYKIKLKNGMIEKQAIIKRDSFFIPDIYLVGYGRQQTYQVCCLKCSNPYFCMSEIKEYQDLFCEDCQDDESKLPEKNISNVNLVGNVIGWLSKIENPIKMRKFRNYKKCYQRDRYTCQYCGYNMQNAKKFMPLHIDHIKPWSCQGGNSLTNLVVSCQECNLIASDKWFSSFEEKKEYVIFEKKKRTF